MITPSKLTCYSQALVSSDWRAAIGAGFDALISNGTWALCPCLLDQNIVRNKWVYKLRRKLDDPIERFKARLVGKGFDQKSGVDFANFQFRN